MPEGGTNERVPVTEECSRPQIFCLRLSTLEVVRCPEHAEGARCCPMGFEQGWEIEALPERRAHDREETRETVRQAGEVGLEAQQDIGNRPTAPLRF